MATSRDLPIRPRHPLLILKEEPDGTTLVQRATDDAGLSNFCVANLASFVDLRARKTDIRGCWNWKVVFALNDFRPSRLLSNFSPCLS